LKRKAVSGIMLTLLLIGMSTLAFNIQPVKAAMVASESPSTTELVYDDGTSEVGPAWNVVGGMFAVQFTAPFYPVKILEARIFFHALNNPSDPIRVHILDDEFNDLTEPIDLTVYQGEEKTWLSVDVSSRNIVLLSGDFFIASEQLVGGDPDIGSDTSSPPQGRSWEFNTVSWYPQPGTNYMIRALVGTLLRTIEELKTEIEELGSEGEIDNKGIVKSLIAKLNVAQKLVDKGKIDEAKSILEDDFIIQVQNLSGIHITVKAADILVQSAEHILSIL